MSAVVTGFNDCEN